MSKKYIQSAVIATLLSLLPVAKSYAIDPWEFEVYRYGTESKGVMEVETLNAVVLDGHSESGGTSHGEFPSEHLWYTSLEFTYGITDDIEAAAYVNFALPEGEEFWYAGSKYRLRGKFFHDGYLPVDLGWYAEISQHKTDQFDDVAAEIEFKPIIEKDFGSIVLRLNPAFEKPLAEGGWEFGASSGIYYKLDRAISPGIEVYDAIGPLGNNDPMAEQQHYIFPVIKGTLCNGIEYDTGVGFGMTSGSDNLIVKLNLELEKYIGSLF